MTRETLIDVHLHDVVRWAEWELTLAIDEGRSNDRVLRQLCELHGVATVVGGLAAREAHNFILALDAGESLVAIREAVRDYRRAWCPIDIVPNILCPMPGVFQ